MGIFTKHIGPMMASATCGVLWLSYFALQANDLTGVLRKARSYEDARARMHTLENLNKTLSENQVDPNQVQLPLDIAESVARAFPASYSELDAAATIIAMTHEAGNQGVRGMQAVAAVVINRVNAHHARTATDAIIAPGQFEFVRAVPILRGKSQEAIINLAKAKEYEPARVALKDMVRVNRYLDPTQGALYFANLNIVRKRAYGGDVMSSKALKFFTKLKPVAVIGQHTFFKG